MKTSGPATGSPSSCSCSLLTPSWYVPDTSSPTVLPSGSMPPGRPDRGRPCCESGASLLWPRGDAVVRVPRSAGAAAPEAEVTTAGATTESDEKTRVAPVSIVVEVRGSRPDADELDVDVEIAAN